MRRRPIFYLLAGVMALALTACKTADLPPEPTLVPSQTTAQTVSPEPATSPSPTPEPSGVEPEVYVPDVPAGDYAPWQTAYADFLTEELRRDEIKVETGNGEISDLYCLYDVDEDGVPELFIQYGVCEADYHTVCYTFRDGRVEALKDGDFPSGHGMIYTCPGESAFLFSWGHMGYAEISKVPVENGGLGEWETLLEENTNPSAAGEEVRPYTHPSELVPGAEAVPYYYTRSCRDWGRNPPLVLPIYDYGDLPRRPEEPREEAEVRAAIGEVLWENRAFNGYSGDNFYGATGHVVLEEYLIGAYPYADESLVVKEYAFADVNADGQIDCVLRLEEEPDEYGNISQYYAVLSLQGEEVYAYFFGFTDGFGVDPDGSVYLRDFGQWEQVSFYKDQCYTFPAPQEPVEGCDLAWEEFVSQPAPAFSLPPGKYEPWQEAYMDYLTALREEEAPLRRWVREATAEELEADVDRANASRWQSDVYWLYDVDKDGVPELFIRYGNLARMDEIRCYACRRGKVVQIGELRDGKGSSLYAWPGENGILDYWAWKGAFVLTKYSVVDGKLVCGEEIRSQYGGPGEPDPRDDVPGTYPLEPCRVRTADREEVPLVLPVCAAGGRWSPAPAGEGDRAAAREAILGVLHRGEKFYSASGNSYVYVGATGWVSLAEYWEDEPRESGERLWMDLDGDGTEECLVRFRTKLGSVDTLILHWQEGTVYGYGVDNYDGDSLTAGGLFYRSDPLWVEDDWGRVLSFYQNQCFWTAVPLPQSPAPAAWESFAPNL